MSKLSLIRTSIFLGCALINSSVSADDTPKETTDNSSERNVTDVSKDNWLKSITPTLPALICKGFVNDPELKKRFDEIKMTYEQCISSLPESVNKCQKQLYSDIPDQINTDNAATFGKSLGECIGKDFTIKYLVPKK
jgi:hypothetical protein